MKIELLEDYMASHWLGRGGDPSTDFVVYAKGEIVEVFDPPWWLKPTAKNGIEHYWTGDVMIPETMAKVVQP